MGSYERRARSPPRDSDSGTTMDGVGFIDERNGGREIAFAETAHRIAQKICVFGRIIPQRIVHRVQRSGENKKSTECEQTRTHEQDNTGNRFFA